MNKNDKTDLPQNLEATLRVRVQVDAARWRRVNGLHEAGEITRDFAHYVQANEWADDLRNGLASVYEAHGTLEMELVSGPRRAPKWAKTGPQGRFQRMNERAEFIPAFYADDAPLLIVVDAGSARVSMRTARSTSVSTGAQQRCR